MPKPKDSDSQAQAQAPELENNSETSSIDEKLLDELTDIGLINAHNIDKIKKSMTEMGSQEMEHFSYSRFLIAVEENVTYEEVTDEFLRALEAKYEQEVEEENREFEKERGIKLQDDSHIPLEERIKRVERRSKRFSRRKTPK